MLFLQLIFAGISVSNDKVDSEDDDDDDDTPVGIRPRRLSQLSLKNKAKPMPLGSSLFIFSSTNRYALPLFYLTTYISEHNL